MLSIICFLLTYGVVIIIFLHKNLNPNVTQRPVRVYVYHHPGHIQDFAHVTSALKVTNIWCAFARVRFSLLQMVPCASYSSTSSHITLHWENTELELTLFMSKLLLAPSRSSVQISHSFPPIAKFQYGRANVGFPSMSCTQMFTFSASLHLEFHISHRRQS